MSTTRSLPVQPTAPRVLRVVITSGPSAGRAIVVDRTIYAGSAETCDLHIAGDPTVSRRHALFQPGEIGVRVIDQDSRNGTYLGETKIRDADLPPQTPLRLASTTLRVEIGDGPAFLRFDAKNPNRSHTPIDRFGRFLGAAPALDFLYDHLQRAAASDASVLLEGESGTGKELLAEALHAQSSRRAGSFVVVDCGAIPTNLIESELFGHERGAFTGADRQHVGAFETAHRGTLFLDELGELPLPMQTRLLRALDKKQIRRLGAPASATIDVDVRVIAATNRNLDREVEDGRFRLDLYHRLAVFPIRVPPLRERASDVEMLARHFVRALGGDEAILTRDVLARLAAHRWPGNVRELRNQIERMVLLGQRGDLDTTGALGDPLAAATAGLPYKTARALALRAFTDAYVRDTLARHGGNVSRAARAAGLARRWFQILKSNPD